MVSNAFLSASKASAQTNQRRVFLLDLDPGQPEYGPPGDLSLIELHVPNLGVPFTHPTVPSSGDGNRLIRSHHIGSPSPKEHPQHYLQCVQDLLRTSTRSQGLESLVLVNCPGWIQGKGLEILKDIIITTEATDVVYTSIAGPEDVVSVLQKACSRTGASLHIVPSQPYQDEAGRTASDLRAMQTLSYFHITEPDAGSLMWNPRPLTEEAPIIVPYAGPTQAIFAVLIHGDEQDPDFFPTILDGSVVGLVLIEEDSAIPIGDVKSTLDSSAFNDLEAGKDMENQVDSTPGALPQSLSDESQPTSSEHLSHPSVSRTRHSIPYLPPIGKITSPLSPAQTRSLGQALIRSIDIRTKCFHLLTPVLRQELQEFYRQKKKIVLVRGKLETPTWAYKEDLECEKARRRRSAKVLGADETTDDDVGAAGKEYLRQWAEGRPWVDVVEEGRATGKARKIRRDIKYRAQSAGGA